MGIQTKLLSCALTLGWGAVALGQQADFISPMVGFYEAGVICAQDAVTTRQAPDTIAGSTNVVEDAPPFVSEGRLVPAVLGIGFGVRAGLASELGQDGVTMTVTHPPLDGTGTTQQSFVTSIGAKTTPGITFYQFDYPYELAVGDWTMTAHYGAVTFYETTFKVVPPQTLPELAGVCGYLDLLS